MKWNISKNYVDNGLYMIMKNYKKSYHVVFEGTRKEVYEKSEKFIEEKINGA